MKLLLIEDEPELAKSIRDYLNGNEFVCEWADHFSSAMEKISVYDYDCILLDLMLPDGDGFDILTELRKQNKTDGVIIISAKETLETIEHFAIDKNKPPQFPTANIEEFSRLNKSIGKLIKKNITIYESQREFLENAAHELQTPIAVFQAKIDTLIQRSDVTEDQSKILGSLNDSVSRLARLNKNLLLLSKIDHNTFNEAEQISINELIRNQLAFFTEQAYQKNIQIEKKGDVDVKVKANTGLTGILLRNLLLNAIQHNEQNGKIDIVLTKKKLNIINTGVPHALSRQKLFSRFSKDHASEQGNGLGLAIVKKIADLNHWSVSYTFTNNLHSFSIQF